MDSALTIFHYYLIIGAEYSRYKWACFSVPVPKMRSFSIYKQNATWYNSTRDIMTRLNNLIWRWLHTSADVAIFFISIFTCDWQGAIIHVEWLRVRSYPLLRNLTVLSGTRRSFFYLHRSTLMLLFKMRHYAPSQSFRRWLHSRTDVAIFFSLFT